MGCNMHAHIEVKRFGKWGHYAAPHVVRDYKLFNLIAGVRADDIANPQLPVCTHFELPEDMSIVSRTCLEQESGFGAHHKGWLDADEIRELQRRLYDIYPDVQRTGIDECDLEESIFHTYIAGNCIADHQGFDDVRLVFWFDN